MCAVRVAALAQVYSLHVYGPGPGHEMPYFDEDAHKDYPANLPKVWDNSFGLLQRAGLPVLVGEWGGRYEERGNRLWVDAFEAYLLSRRFAGSFFWALIQGLTQRPQLLIAWSAE